MVPADGAVVDNDVPCPEGDGVPLSCEKEEGQHSSLVFNFPQPHCQSGARSEGLTFLTSNRFLTSPSPPFFLATGGASVISTSAIFMCIGIWCWWDDFWSILERLVHADNLQVFGGGGVPYLIEAVCVRNSFADTTGNPERQAASVANLDG